MREEKIYLKKERREVMQLLSLLSSAPASLLEGPLGLEILAPRDFEAWSGDLVVWTRQSPLQRNLSSDHLFLQLLLGQSVLDQRPIPQESVGNWEKVGSKFIHIFLN